jgi:predicted MFS family arabinose efflux permease
MPATGALVATVAPRRVVQCGFLAAAGLLPIITLADSTWQLLAVLAGWRAGIGAVDVGVNTEAARVQERLGRRIMSRFHAAYGAGGLVSARIGAAAAASGVSAQVNSCSLRCSRSPAVSFLRKPSRANRPRLTAQRERLGLADPNGHGP